MVGNGLFVPKIAVAVAALTILTLVSPAAAQSFTGADYTLVGESPGRAATGDLDGDGDPDIAVPTQVPGSDGYVEVLLNLGDGSFGAPTQYGAGLAPRSVAMADLDGDGDLDLAVANPGTVSWLANNGDGTFDAPQSYPFQDEIVALAIGEMEGDTDLDLVVLETSDSGSWPLHSREAWVTPLYGDGSGGFIYGSTDFAGGWSYTDDPPYYQLPSVDSLALGDLDGNGYLDVLVGATVGLSSLSQS